MGETLAASETVNGWLQGSPYLVPADETGEERARSLLDEQIRIRARQQKVQSEFEAQAEALRAELERDFDVRLIFESNAIEGVETSLIDTRAFLEMPSESFLTTYSFSSGVSADPKLLEVVGHGHALSFVRELANSLDGRPLREVDIRNIHALAMAAEPRIAGHYKTMDNEIGGRHPSYLTARAEEVPLRVRKLVEWLEEARVHGPLLAAVASAWLADIHPFDDGNGRVSRLLANYVLLKYGWPCLIIRAGPDRQRYYDALASSDGCDIGPLFSLYVEGLHRSLSEMEDPEFARLLLDQDLKRQDAFEAWRALLQKFTLLLQSALCRVGLRMDVVGYIDEADFAWLERRDPAGNGWWSKVRSSDGLIDALLWFGYQSDDLLSSESGLKPMPSVFFSERNNRPEAIHPYRPLWGDPRLSVHEVSLQPRSKNERALLRQGQDVREVTLPDAASLLADSLVGLGA